MSSSNEQNTSRIPSFNDFKKGIVDLMATQEKPKNAKQVCKKNIDCGNGKCRQGVCECPPGFTGKDCRQRETLIPADNDKNSSKRKKKNRRGDNMIDVIEGNPQIIRKDTQLRPTRAKIPMNIEKFKTKSNRPLIHPLQRADTEYELPDFIALLDEENRKKRAQLKREQDLSDLKLLNKLPTRESVAANEEARLEEGRLKREQDLYDLELLNKLPTRESVAANEEVRLEEARLEEARLEEARLEEARLKLVQDLRDLERLDVEEEKVEKVEKVLDVEDVVEDVEDVVEDVEDVVEDVEDVVEDVEVVKEEAEVAEVEDVVADDETFDEAKVEEERTQENNEEESDREQKLALKNAFNIAQRAAMNAGESVKQADDAVLHAKKVRALENELKSKKFWENLFVVNAKKDENKDLVITHRNWFFGPSKRKIISSLTNRFEKGSWYFGRVSASGQEGQIYGTSIGLSGICRNKSGWIGSLQDSVCTNSFNEEDAIDKMNVFFQRQIQLVNKNRDKFSFQDISTKIHEFHFEEGNERIQKLKDIHFCWGLFRKIIERLGAVQLFVKKDVSNIKNDTNVTVCFPKTTKEHMLIFSWLRTDISDVGENFYFGVPIDIWDQEISTESKDEEKIVQGMDFFSESKDKDAHVSVGEEKAKIEDSETNVDEGARESKGNDTKEGVFGDFNININNHQQKEEKTEESTEQKLENDRPEERELKNGENDLNIYNDNDEQNSGKEQEQLSQEEQGLSQEQQFVDDDEEEIYNEQEEQEEEPNNDDDDEQLEERVKEPEDDEQPEELVEDPEVLEEEQEVLEEEQEDYDNDEEPEVLEEEQEVLEEELEEEQEVLEEVLEEEQEVLEEELEEEQEEQELTNKKKEGEREKEKDHPENRNHFDETMEENTTGLPSNCNPPFKDSDIIHRHFHYHQKSVSCDSTEKCTSNSKCKRESTSEIENETIFGTLIHWLCEEPNNSF